MAIQKSISEATGVTHTAAYTIISGIFLTPVSALVNIKIYHDAASRSKADATAEKLPFVETRLKVPSNDVSTYFADGVLDDANKSPIKQSYAWLKTQSDQAGIDWTTGTTDV